MFAVWKLLSQVNSLNSFSPSTSNFFFFSWPQATNFDWSSPRHCGKMATRKTVSGIRSSRSALVLIRLSTWCTAKSTESMETTVRAKRVGCKFIKKIFPQLVRLDNVWSFFPSPFIRGGRVISDLLAPGTTLSSHALHAFIRCEHSWWYLSVHRYKTPATIYPFDHRLLGLFRARFLLMKNTRDQLVD